METTQSTITIRMPKVMRDQIMAEASEQDLTASQLIRRHLTAKYAAAKKSTPQPPTGSKKSQRKEALV